MKEDAGKVGSLADLEILLQLLDGVDGALKAGQQVLAETAESVEERKKRNNQLKMWKQEFGQFPRSNAFTRTPLAQETNIKRYELDYSAQIVVWKHLVL